MIAITALLSMAQAPGGGEGGTPGSMLSSMVPLLLVFVIFYFMLLRPQMKQQKKVKEMLGNLKKGDKVITRGGCIGTVHGIADNIVTLEVAENVKMKFSRDAIASVQAGVAATGN